ncbi:hypothetical protein EVAR_85977_1 [Eumeta japonica]|uniref:Uncharacterized protein n=1 Tax=Eumeta variegata TaxID=151549 RepID=A0A4C1UJ76_EUMVA|nr:hypothetical protein EVAR_85977_1 [Eumeta japonica]
MRGRWARTDSERPGTRNKAGEVITHSGNPERPEGKLRREHRQVFEDSKQTSPTVSIGIEKGPRCAIRGRPKTTSSTIRCWRSRLSYITVSSRAVMFMRGSNGARSGTTSAQSASPGGREPPKCMNCIEAGCKDTAHRAFSSEYGVRHNWDKITRCEAAPQRRPVKAAIIILGCGVDVEEDQTLINENITATMIKAGNCRISVVSVYFEGDTPIGPYIDRVCPARNSERTR